MGIQHTTNFGIAYMDDLTPLTDLDDVTRQVAESLDAAMGKAGYVPPDSSTFAALVAAVTPAAWQLAASQTVANFATAPAGQANWPKLSYRRENAKTVRVRGGMVGATVTAGQALFTLPADCRPLTYHYLPAGIAGNQVVGMYVQPDGKVVFAAAGSFTNLLINATFSLD